MDTEKSLNSGINLITLKLVDNLTVLPFLAAAGAIGAGMFFVDIYKAAASALVVFCIVGGAEYGYRQAQTEFEKLSHQLKSISGSDSETFLKLSDKVFKVGGWNPAAKEVIIDGLIYLHVTTDVPSPFQAIGGPVCPKCKKSLYCSPKYLFPGLTRYEYKCLCGFEKTLKKDPKTLYLKARTHFNLPLL